MKRQCRWCSDVLRQVSRSEFLSASMLVLLHCHRWIRRFYKRIPFQCLSRRISSPRTKDLCQSLLSARTSDRIVGLKTNNEDHVDRRRTSHRFPDRVSHHRCRMPSTWNGLEQSSYYRSRTDEEGKLDSGLDVFVKFIFSRVDLSCGRIPQSENKINKETNDSSISVVDRLAVGHCRHHRFRRLHCQTNCQGHCRSSREKQTNVTLLSIEILLEALAETRQTNKDEKQKKKEENFYLHWILGEQISSILFTHKKVHEN